MSGFQWIGRWFHGLDQKTRVDQLGSAQLVFSGIGSLFFMDDRTIVKAFSRMDLAFSRFFKDLLLYLVRARFPFVT